MNVPIYLSSVKIPLPNKSKRRNFSSIGRVRYQKLTTNSDHYTNNVTYTKRVLETWEWKIQGYSIFIHSQRINY